MSRDLILKEIDKLGLSEKVLMVEELWDLIARDSNSLPMPEWQKIELDKRQQAFENSEVELHDWQIVHKRLRNSS